MPDDAFTKKFNATAKAAVVAQAAATANSAKYKKTVLSEYPRLMNELFERVTAIFKDVPAAKIAAGKVKVTLTRNTGVNLREVQEVGVVEVQEFSVSFLNKSVVFQSGGIGFVGAYGKIEVSTNTGHNPFGEHGVLMLGSKDEGKWTLGVASSTGRGRAVALTDERLKELLEAALLK